MASCTRCGRQTEGGAEFCTGCGEEMRRPLPDLSPAATAMAGAASYLRPFAAPGTLAPTLSETADDSSPLAERSWPGWQSQARDWTGADQQTGSSDQDSAPDGLGAASLAFAAARMKPPVLEPAEFEPAPNDRMQRRQWAGDRSGASFEADVFPGSYRGLYQQLAPDDKAGDQAFPVLEPQPGPTRHHPLVRRPHNGRWISILAAAVVVIMATAATFLLTDHGKSAGQPASRHHTSAPAPKQSSQAAAPPGLGTKLVAVTQAVANTPGAPAVVRFLTRYFTAINEHDYAAYSRLFSPALRDGLSVQAFETGYGSSQDSQATLQSISTAGAGEIAAAVTFTSHQQAAASPTQSACTAWNISLYLMRQDGRYVIVSPPAGYTPQFTSCG